MAFRRSDGGSSRKFGSGRNCSCEPAALGGHVGLCLPEHTRGIWAPRDRYRAGQPRNGGKHHTLARPTTPRNSALRRGVLPGAQPSREQNQQREHPLGATPTHDILGESTWRVFRRDRLADYLCDWSGGSRGTGPWDETECVASSAKVFVDRWGVCDCKPRQPLWISLACPRWPISRVIVLFAAHQ